MRAQLFRRPPPAAFISLITLAAAVAGPAAGAPAAADTPAAGAPSPAAPVVVGGPGPSTSPPVVAGAAPAASVHGRLPAEAEPPIAAAGAEGDFLRAMHKAIHFRWVNRFLEPTVKSRPANDPINSPDLQAEVLFVVRWDGSYAQAAIGDKSGVPEFDAAALAAVKGDAPYPVPPIDVYGEDGVAHVRWVFRRDQRLCSGGEIRRLDSPLSDSLPRLFYQGRVKEALLRVVRESRTGHPDAMSEFARAYLARPFPDAVLDAQAAAALARTGDPRAIERTRRAVARPETMPIAAPALAAAKVDLCAFVRPALEGPAPDVALFASQTLRNAGVELAPDSPCVAAMTSTIKAGVAPGALRADLLDTLATTFPGGVRRLALEATGDKDPKVRAAGARALARPKGGRPTLYRLQPLIGDASIEVRTAVAAGLVRACGDLATDFLQPIIKGRDVQPLVAMTEELGRASSPASAELLAKLQKRPEPELRLPVLAALAARQDPAGRALYRPLAENIKKDSFAPADARRIVYAAADLDELAHVAKDPLLGIYTYRALLRAGRHAEAMDWLVASYDRLPPEVMVEALSAWLASPPGKLSAR
jgi:hypothetical protein